MSSPGLDEKPAAIGTPAIPAPRRRWPWLVGIGLACAALAGAAYHYFGKTPTQEAPAAGPGGAGKGDGKKGGRFGGGGGPPPVVVATVQLETMDVRLAALGNVIPRNSVVVRSRVDGPLLRLHFTEGQTVKAGQLLAEIDPQPLQVALAQANGQMARDQALLQNALIDLNRYKGLLATDSIAKQQVDTQEATVRQYQGVVATDRGQVEAAKLQLSYARVVAPIAGQVGLRQVDPGNMVRASDANGIVSITQMNPITVVFAIPEAQVGSVLRRMRDGTPVPVEAWDSGQKNRLGAGKLLSTDNQIDVTTGTLKLKAEFPNPDGQLFPNQFVNVRVLLGQEKDLVVVPSAAVQRGSQGTFAYVIKGDSTATMRPIKTGLVDGERVAITSGLAAGERVVIDGADRLREGARVEVIDRNTPPPGARNPDAKDDPEREERRRRFREIMQNGTDAQKAEARQRMRERSEASKAAGDGPPGKGPGTASGAPAAAPAPAGSSRPPADVPAKVGEGTKSDDPEREERRRRFREIMQNGTEEQKAEMRQRFRERMEANPGSGGAPAKSAP